MSSGEFITYKLRFWLVPIMAVALLLTWLTNRFLDADPVMASTAFILTLLLTPGLCSLGVGLGARFPRFETENLAQVPTGYGGLIFMAASSLSLILIIGLSAWPVVRYLRIKRFMSPVGLKEGILIPLLAVVVIVLAWQLWRKPYKIGRSALEVYDEETKSLDIPEEELDNKPKNYRFRKREKMSSSSADSENES
jgi:ABC-2 type transport system permease protein